MSQFEVGDFAFTQNSVWSSNDGLLVQVVAVNAKTQAETMVPYAIRRVDQNVFEASLQATTGIPKFFAERVVGCAEHQLRSGSKDEILAAFVTIAKQKQVSEPEIDRMLPEEVST